MTAKRCHFLQLGFYRVGGRGAFIELCLHFWSFLRDTLSRERPAWSHLLRSGAGTIFSNAVPPLPVLC